MTVQYLEEKVHDMQEVQKTILLRLENIEKLVQSQVVEKRTGCTQDEPSWQHNSYNDFDYWRSCYSSTYHQDTQPHFTSPLASPRQPPLTSTQYQYIQPPYAYVNALSQFASTLASTQPHLPSPLASTQPHLTSPLASTQPHLTSPLASTSQLSSTSQYGPNTQDGFGNSMPKALPIWPKPNATSLSSSEINKVDLVATDVFFQRHHNLKGESRAGTLAVKLAREVYFGSQVMSKCTMSGCQDLPGLPTAELGELKQTLFLQFPQFWKNPIEFEPLWSKCVEAINQSCKKIRQT